MAEATPADSGGAPRVSAPPPDGILRIRGGKTSDPIPMIIEVRMFGES